MVAATEAGGGRGPHGERVGRDGRQLRACGAIRISTGRQSEGHSPAVQRAAVLQRARADGYAISEEDLFEDAESGHALERKGYQALLRGVREGRYSAIYCFMLDRFGRDSIERQQRGKELDGLGVPLVSCLEGTDEPGVLRAFRAALAEEESVKNAQRVRPAREKSAREGVHAGQTPYGYERRYPEHGSGHQPAGMLVPHEPEASVVKELFERYSSGEWSTKDLARDLNRRGIPGPRPRRKEEGPTAWTTSAICRLLRNITYTGLVRYNAKPQGRFERAEPGTAFTVDGKHAPLVDPSTFERVQARLNDGRTYTRNRNGHTETLIIRASGGRPLLTGLLVCHECAGPMAVVPPREGRAGEARCQRRANGENCAAVSYRSEIAEEALLREIGRLHGAPWSASGGQLLAGPDDGRAQRIAKEIEALRARLDDATEQLLDRQLQGPARASLERVHARLNGHVAELEQQQAALAHDAATLPRLRQLHTKLSTLSPARAAAQLQAQGDMVGLRDLLTLLIDHAVLAERWPARRSTWLRFSVQWQPDVQQLLDAGLLTLDPPEEAPGR